MKYEVAEIKNIDFKKITTSTGIFYSSNIISTIPFHSLLKVVSNGSVSFKLSNIPIESVNYFMTSEDKPDHFQYVYSISDVWYRKSYDKIRHKWIYETHEPQLFEEEYKNLIVDKYKLESQITKSIGLKELGNIKLVGRYAQLDHSIKTENVIHWAHNYTRKFQGKNNEKT